jgi:hypothetical protein
MNTDKHGSEAQPLDLARWRNVPAILMGGGALVSLIGALVNAREFAYSWLLGFMFFLSLCLGALFLVIVHHLFDAGWSVPIRRFCEHIASLLFPCMALLFLPIAFLAKKIYPWMGELIKDPQHIDHALKAKAPLFTVPGFYWMTAALFVIWFLLTNRLRYWSLKQDVQTSDSWAAGPGFIQRLFGVNQEAPGVVECTRQMRKFAAIGILLFAVTLTMGAVMWMKGLEHEWFSTMYGVYYFAGSVWTMLATAYVITMILDRQGVLTEVLHEHQYYFLGSLMFAFTVFYAYIHFAQYFIIWNGNMPEETFWYVVREHGTWFWVGIVIIFGHFFLPFLALLRIDVKNVFSFMLPLCAWAWLMHFVDLSFNIMPVAHREGYPLRWVWLHVGCWAFMAGLLTWLFLRKYAAHPPYPIKDPRLIEAMGHFHPVPTQISGGELDEADDLRDAPPQFRGGPR